MNMRNNTSLKKWLPMLLVAVAFLILLLAVSQFLSDRSENENYILLQRAVQRAAVECYALEGFYPTSLTYLEDHYGIAIEESAFFVDYQYVAANLMPDITILPRH
ncbi:MAG: hypothetical protein LIO58_03620 [Oscillospiraceae bacterium]|nr:hypothetical protein [Oscillospiraceae bacterium]